MKLKEFDILLDVKRHKKIEEFEIVQGDYETNILKISLVEDLNEYELSGLDIEIAFAKSDGTTVLQDINNGIELLGNKIRCTLKTNTIASPGKVLAEARVLEGTKLLTSSRFSFFVRKSIVNDETIESTNEFPILNDLIDDVSGLLDEIEGKPEIQGYSAYQVWLNEGNIGTVDDYLSSLIGQQGKSIEFNWEGKNLGVRIEGEEEYQYIDLQGERGDIGNGLEYEWLGTELGVREKGTIDYTYVDLRGPTGSIENLDKGNIEDALGYTPIKSVNGELPETDGSLTLELASDIEVVNNLDEIVTGKALDATQGKIINDDLESHKADYATQIALKANKTQENFISPVFENGWTSTGGSTVLRYFKSTIGIVYLSGQARSGTISNGTVITTLPIGYRPTVPIIAASVRTNDGTYVRVDIGIDGAIKIYGLTATSDISINVAFRAS